MGASKCQSSSVECWIKTQQRLAPHPQGAGRGTPHPLEWHCQSITITPSTFLWTTLLDITCLWAQHTGPGSWQTGLLVLFSGARDRNCSPHSASARRASLLPAPWGTVWHLWEAFWLAVPQPSASLAQLFLAILQVVFYAKEMPTQKSPTHPSCFQPCW